jgi:LysM repeat protein
VVQPDDTLTYVARSFGTTVDALMAANGLTSTAITVGQVLKIP